MTQRGPNGPRRIVLTGFMGAGKTTVGRLLASRLGWPFLDIDQRIAAEQQLSIADIFARRGEPHFRALELAAIQSALAQDPVVLALGGGAIETPGVRALLLPSPDPTSAPRHFATDTVTIYLAAPLPELLARCHAEPAAGTVPVRPLLASTEGGSAAVEQRFAHRLPFYRQAHLIVDTAELAPQQVVTHILDALFAPFPAQNANREIPAQ